jgi:hypothetical protein
VERHRPWLRSAEFLGGFLFWSAQFTAVYMATSVACGRGLGEATLLGVNVVTLIVLATSASALAGAAALLLLALRRRRAGGLDRSQAFLNDATALISGLALVAIAYTAVPALLVPACP